MLKPGLTKFISLHFMSLKISFKASERLQSYEKNFDIRV